MRGQKQKVNNMANPSPTEEEVFNYLCELRDSGEVNMWGCPAYIASKFNIAPHEAMQWFTVWKQNPDKYNEKTK
jgi:hypothetical protein